VKPVVSLILARQDLAGAVMPRLAAYFGPPDLLGPWWPFDTTAYYAPEMGQGLGRRLVAFLHLGHPGRLSAWKHFTNRLEEDFSLAGRRLVNLDPGYISTERLVLATGKNYSHRLYLDRNIFADLTLIYGRGDFQALPWSYPDYAQDPLRGLLGLVRRKYLWQLRQFSCQGARPAA
jgi:hypothetical protein